MKKSILAGLALLSIGGLASAAQDGTYASKSKQTSMCTMNVDTKAPYLFQKRFMHFTLSNGVITFPEVRQDPITITGNPTIVPFADMGDQSISGTYTITLNNDDTINFVADAQITNETKVVTTCIVRYTFTRV